MITIGFSKMQAIKKQFSLSTLSKGIHDKSVVQKYTFGGTGRLTIHNFLYLACVTTRRKLSVVCGVFVSTFCALALASNATSYSESEMQVSLNLTEVVPARKVRLPNVRFVAPIGDDRRGDGSAGKPWKTISHAINRISSGDSLIIKNGVYVGKENFLSGIPAGTPLRPTVIMAESPMEVRIQSASSLGYNDNQLHVTGSHITIDGFIFDMAATKYPPYIGEIEGSFVTVSRSIFKRSGDIDEYGGLLQVSGSDNLLEDLAGVGACRYCFKQGGTSGSTQRNIWRRVIGRFDYSNSAQPKATFSTYGNDSVATNGVYDHLYQNVIAIDGQNPGANGGDEKYGGFLTAKAASRVQLQGCIVLNEGVGYSGMHLRDYQSGTSNGATHSVVWDLKGSRPKAAGIRGTWANHVTVGGDISGKAVDLDGPARESRVEAQIPVQNLLNNNPGAIILKKYGKSRTHWGETGFDTLTNEALWPWPYEDKIKAVFSEPNDPPTKNSPSLNITKRGFSAEGTGLYGGPITLTSYIWEYLGEKCPKNICRTNAQAN